MRRYQTKPSEESERENFRYIIEQKIKHAEDDKDYKKTILLYKEALDFEKNDSELKERYGACLIKAKKFKKAIKYYTSLLNPSPSDTRKDLEYRIMILNKVVSCQFLRINQLNEILDKQHLDEKQINSIKIGFDYKQKENEKLKEELKNSQGLKESLEEQLKQTLEGQGRERKRQIKKKFQEKISTLGDENRILSNEVSSLKNKNQVLENENERLLNTLKELQSQLEESKAKYQEDTATVYLVENSDSAEPKMDHDNEDALENNQYRTGIDEDEDEVDLLLLDVSPESHKTKDSVSPNSTSDDEKFNKKEDKKIANKETRFTCTSSPCPRLFKPEPENKEDAKKPTAKKPRYETQATRTQPGRAQRNAKQVNYRILGNGTEEKTKPSSDKSSKSRTNAKMKNLDSGKKRKFGNL
jgi:hypothetical protein